MTGRLSGKVALITGGAGSIGLATARAFVAEGAKVMIVDLSEDALVRAAASCDSDDMVWRATDVTDSEQVRAAVQATVGEFGRLDIAFANAGVFGVIAPSVHQP